MPSSMRLLIEPSGEFPVLAKNEILAVCNSEGSYCDLLDEDDGAIITDTDADPEKIAERLALAWHVNEHCFSCDAEDVVNNLQSIALQDQTFAARVRRIGEKWSGRDVQEMTEDVGEILSRQTRVDLDNPEVVIRVLMSNRCHAGKRLFDIDRPAFEERRPQNRPFATPVTLHPKLARALVNLSGVRRGGTVLDPFCGTGGLLLEAALVGVKCIGSDIDPEMLVGCKKNLEHFNIFPKCYELMELDVGRVAGHVKNIDAIVTDPPYGRSATTMKEGLEKLYSRSFKVFSEILGPGKKLAITLPDPGYAKIGEKYFRLLSVDEVYVHKSLSRYFCVFRS